ncbi:restriction endonuclease subunit S [Haploplasma modicum]|uniref:restriction endonuclease subunit S n=1 Tax=Haploplasma modicum TaxID=2150 RepID=UPI00054F2B93|nr:restriction endonuclease subunit S [Haploplasma modicum]
MSKINHIAIQISSGLTPLRSNNEFWNKREIPWLKTEQLGDFIITDTNEYISKQALDATSIKLFPKNTVSVAMYGEGKTRGNVSILGREMCTNQACCNIVVDDKKANYKYVYYWLKNSYIALRKLAAGVRKNLNSDDIKNFDIDLKTREEQDKISNLLYSLDIKIRNNNRINAELETMAKTLYDYWFLQFEFPNEEGKPYKSSGGKMIWNEELKREIPEGWKTIKLKNIVKKTNRVYDYNKESKTYDLSIMPSNSISINDTSSSKDFETNLFAVKEGDILFGSIRPYLRKAGIASYDGAVAGTIHCYEVIKESDYNLALFTLTSENMFKYAINNSKGTKMPVITSDDLLEFMLPYNEEIAKKFNKIKIREIIIANIKQSNELTSLRDFLLPLLMNGQVKFKDN